MSDFIIEDFTPERKANPYDSNVAALIEAGEDKVGGIKVATAEVAKERLKFQRAANAAERTARVVREVENDDDTTTVFFRLTKRQERGANKPAETVTEGDTPETVEESVSDDTPKPRGKRGTVAGEATE